MGTGSGAGGGQRAVGCGCERPAGSSGIWDVGCGQQGPPAPLPAPAELPQHTAAAGAWLCCLMRPMINDP